MKVLAVTVRVKKEKVDTARSFFNSFVQPSRKEEGCIQYELFHSENDKQIFYFFEKWADIMAFEKHCTQPFLKEFKNRYDELLEVPNQLLWLTPVD